MPQLKWHAQQRSAQRNVSASEIQYVIKHGQRFHKAGVRIHYLRRCDIPDDDLADDQITRLVGTSVILSKDGQEVITVWRNRQDGLKHIKRKPKHSTQSRQVQSGEEQPWLN